MKKLLLISMIITVVLTGCRKDVTDETDITKSVWKVKSLTIDGEINKTPKKDECLRDEAYMLVFENDSTFIFDTSVNFAFGTFVIADKGTITVFAYTEITEVGDADVYRSEFNADVLMLFREVTSYKVLGNILTFNGTKGEVKFKRE